MKPQGRSDLQSKTKQNTETLKGCMPDTLYKSSQHVEVLVFE